MSQSQASQIEDPHNASNPLALQPWTFPAFRIMSHNCHLDHSTFLNRSILHGPCSVSLKKPWGGGGTGQIPTISVLSINMNGVWISTWEKVAPSHFYILFRWIKISTTLASNYNNIPKFKVLLTRLFTLGTLSLVRSKFPHLVLHDFFYW